jgi:hypothetical protein
MDAAYVLRHGYRESLVAQGCFLQSTLIAPLLHSSLVLNIRISIVNRSSKLSLCASVFIADSSLYGSSSSGDLSKPTLAVDSGLHPGSQYTPAPSLNWISLVTSRTEEHIPTVEKVASPSMGKVQFPVGQSTWILADGLLGASRELKYIAPAIGPSSTACPGLVENAPEV